MNNLNIEFQQLVQQFSNSSQQLLLNPDYQNQKPSCLGFHPDGFQNLIRMDHIKTFFGFKFDSGWDPP
jgi:hypothetical protein